LFKHHISQIKGGGNMLYIVNYNLKENKEKEFQKSIKENKKAISDHAPKGWRFMGVYFYALGFEPCHAADFGECSDYADFDAWRTRDDPTWLRL
jgi:hypothetical protein